MVSRHDNNNEKTNGYISTWEPEIADKIRRSLKLRSQDSDSSSQQPYMICLVGIPGGGKSVSSEILSNLLAEQEQDAEVTIMPHDGYHIPLEQLRELSDAEDAIYRRGAPDTFDPLSLKRDLERIRYGNESQIAVPGFDHSRADPEPGQHVFDRRRHKVVICEGLYLLHDSEGWEDIASMFDMKIFIESDVDACVERLKIRNLCIPGYTPDEIRVRCEVVDRKNAMTVMQSRYRADEIVQSLASRPSASSHQHPSPVVPAAPPSLQVF